MNYNEVFQKYLHGEIAEEAAAGQLSVMIKECIDAGWFKEAARAEVVRTYFIRYRQYDSGEISPRDFLLYLRELILFAGKMRLPRWVTDLVSGSGSETGLYVTGEGSVDVVGRYPEYLQNVQTFVEEVYHLDDSQTGRTRPSAGDGLLRKNSVFPRYCSFEQKIAVHTAVNLPDDYTLMVSLPTGGGKSLITQVLAACEQKLTLVIVPTVSLAMDQYNQARKCMRVDSEDEVIFYYKGRMSDFEISKIVWAVKNNRARLLIVSPEAILKNKKLNEALRYAAENRYLRNVVIDEAHIVPDWGVKFRPEFQIFTVLLKEWRLLARNTLRTYLLSATLSEDVVSALFDLFGQEGRNLQYRCDSLRQEPRYIFLPARNYTKRESMVLELVKCLPKPMIVYVIEPGTAERYRKLLREQGFRNIGTFTGKTEESEKEEILRKWKSNEMDIIFATSAFGVGVDKSNVRTIIHGCVPENLNRFYQEVGRGGRDGFPSLSVMVPYMGREDSESDLKEAFGLVKGNVLTVENLIPRWKSILSGSYSIMDGDVVTADLNAVPESFTQEEAQRAGMQNMGWNVNMLLLMYRCKYIDIIGVEFDAVKKTYYFKFKLLDTDLLTDFSRLETELKPDRQREYALQVEGYFRIRELVCKPGSKCWGKHFSALFPLAESVCQGCPFHPTEKIGGDKGIRIRQKLLVHREAALPNKKLERLMGGALLDMLLTVEENGKVDIGQLLDRIETLEVSALVLPAVPDENRISECLLLSYEEFIVVSRNVPWLFYKGIAILLGNNADQNNQIYCTANSEHMRQYRRVWVCSEDTYISSRQRRMNDFLEGRTESLEKI